MIGPFCIPFPFYLSKHWLLTGQFCMEVMSHYFQLKSGTPAFFKKAPVYQKRHVKVTVLETFKMSRGSRIKTC